MVTARVLPWMLSMLVLGACGGVTGPSAGDGGNAPAHGQDNRASNGGRQDEKSPLGGQTSNGGEKSPGDAGGNASGGFGGASGGSRASVGEGGLAEGGSSPAYPGRGFIVHEWGTDTVVVGSDGSLQAGLHHEEEDLPPFVYDRLKAGAAIGDAASPSVTIKMETPVTYFYSDKPVSVHASVRFPKGVLTQWYPAVNQFLPPIAAPGSATGVLPTISADPALDPKFPFATAMCSAKWQTVGGGLLDWKEVYVLARGTDLSANMPAAPLDRYTWSYARQVDANPLLFPFGEAERFLFYRGLGDFDLPVRVTATTGGELTLENRFPEAMGTLFSMNVGTDRGAFIEHASGIMAGEKLVTRIPELDHSTGLEDYRTSLAQAVTDALDRTGLYHDESLAMVHTWQRQWFSTPGARLLYVIPQRWTDESIPLSIDPKPDQMLRVMLIRVEVITPEQEAADVAAVGQLAASASPGRAHFTALGRFAEPRLRRALALSPSEAGAALLEEIRSKTTTVAAGE